MLAIKTNGLTLYSDPIYHILKIKQQVQGPKFSSQFKLKGPLSYLQQNMVLQKHSLQIPAKPQSFQATTKQIP